jgi:hypothetical protein
MIEHSGMKSMAVASSKSADWMKLPTFALARDRNPHGAI